MKPFRFALRLNLATDARTWRDTVREIEELGYGAISVCDHLDAQWGPLVALTVAAECTTTLTLSTGVLNNDLRHPAVLAKEIATLDLISGGRVELGLGAGWKAIDYTQLGQLPDRPGLRIARLDEAVDALRALWRSGPASYSGEHYQLTDAVGLPMPARSGGPPICIGGGGRRLLSLAGRKADIVGFNTTFPQGRYDHEALLAAGAERFDERVGWVRAAAGDRFDELELQCDTNFVSIGSGRAERVAGLSKELGLDIEVMSGMPLALVGEISEVCEELQARRERWGFSYWIVDHEAMREFAPVVRRLAGQ